MDWFAYYELAEEWVNNEGEAHKRSAVSRAYYAMFHTARYKLKKMEEQEMVEKYEPPDCGSEHIYMWGLYKGNPYYRQIGVLGTRLRVARNKADYDDFIDHFPETVETAMLDAVELKDALDGLWV